MYVLLPLFNWVLSSAAQTQAGSSFRGGWVCFYCFFYFVFVVVVVVFEFFLRVWAHRRIPLHTPCLRFTQTHTHTHTHTQALHTPPAITDKVLLQFVHGVMLQAPSCVLVLTGVLRGTVLCARVCLCAGPRVTANPSCHDLTFPVFCRQGYPDPKTQKHCCFCHLGRTLHQLAQQLWHAASQKQPLDLTWTSWSFFVFFVFFWPQLGLQAVWGVFPDILAVTAQVHTHTKYNPCCRNRTS